MESSPHLGKGLSCLNAIINNPFSEQHTFNKGVIEFITQAIAELKKDGVQPDEHQYHMTDFICLN